MANPKNTRRIVLICLYASLSLPVHAQGRIDTTHAYSIKEVVITGSNRPMSKGLLPYSVSVIDGEELESACETKLLSAISLKIPSMFVAERNIYGFGVSTGGSGGIKIRGVGGSPTSEVLVMTNGQPQYAGIYSHHVADVYTIAPVERVEVLRGPASVLYGSNAMGGVINIITKQAVQEGAHAGLSSQYGSYNTWLTNLSGTVRKGKFSALATMGYDRTDGLQDNFDFRQANLYVKTDYRFNRQWELVADYSLTNFVGNDPVYPTLDDPESTDIYHQNITRGSASMSLNNHYASTHGNVSVYFSYGNHFIEDPTLFHSLDNRFGIRAYQHFPLWKGATAMLGFDFDTYHGSIPVSGGIAHSEGSITTLSGKSVTEYAPYLTWTQEAGLVTLNAGLRMAGSDRFTTRWVPQGGVTFHPGKGWLFKASLAKGYRNPSFREMYLYRTANPDLDPEEMMNYEVTIGKSFSRYVELALTGYYSHGSNLIQTVDMLNVNTGRFTNKGIEVTLHGSPNKRIDLGLAYSYLHTSLDELTGAPKNQYLVSADWTATNRLKVHAELRGVGGLYVSETVENQTYVLLNIKLSYKLIHALEVFVTGNNLTDSNYMINRGYEMPGINIMGGFKCGF